MTGAVALAFAVGMLATITPCGLPFALAALGLPASAPGGGRPASLKRRLASATATGALAGATFAATFVAAVVIEAIGVEVSDLAPAAALASAAVLLAVGAVSLAGASRPAVARRRGNGAAALFGLAYAIASLPCALGLLHALIDQSVKGRGDSAALGVSILFAAGVVAALIAISLLAALFAAVTRRLGAFGAALGGALTAAAGIAAAIYWVPAVAGGVGERGGALSEALAEASGAIAELVAVHELAFALVLLAAAGGALVAAIRRPLRV